MAENVCMFHFNFESYTPLLLFFISGHYCPAGTNYSTEYKCPVGTYNNDTGLKMESDCLPCPGGYYCDQLAQTTFVGICSAG